MGGSPVPQSQSGEELGGGVLSFETEPKELGLTVGPHMISWVSVGCSGTQESPELGPAGLVVTAKSSQARTGPDLSSLRTGINRVSARWVVGLGTGWLLGWGRSGRKMGAVPGSGPGCFLLPTKWACVRLCSCVLLCVPACCVHAHIALGSEAPGAKRKTSMVLW